jgi:hypothetical protein
MLGVLQPANGCRSRPSAIVHAVPGSAEKQLRAAGIEHAGGNAEALGRALKREIDKVNEVVKNASMEPQ